MSKKLTPLETYHLLCERFVEEINETEGKNVAKDYFYNKKYEVGFRDKETGKIGYTADIEIALKQLEEKEHKALEIIKKRLSAKVYVEEDNVVPYILETKINNLTFKYEIDKEQFDLLKEVLK